MPQSLFTQSVIAIIWDFDKTLTPNYMQGPLFKKFGVDEKTFWEESNGLADYYKHSGIGNILRDSLYLNHMLAYVNAGIFKGLNNQLLFELGREIEFYDGLPDFFRSVKGVAPATDQFVKHGVTVEHYIVSTGLRQMILGSKIAQYVDGVWGCEFVEHLAGPGYLKKQLPLFDHQMIQGIGYALDNTTKTRALFEINKGTNKIPDIDVNASIAFEDRRIPFQNMIYIADGPSDMPCFSIVNQYGGRTFAVYKPKSPDSFRAVDKLQKQNRVQGIGEASYVEGSLAAMWITNAVNEIGSRIVTDRNRLFNERVGSAPQHIISDIESTLPQRKPVTAAQTDARPTDATGTEGAVRT